MATALAIGVPMIELFRPPEDLSSGELRGQLEALEQIDAQRSSVIPTNKEEAIRLALLELSAKQIDAALYAEKTANMFKRL